MPETLGEDGDPLDALVLMLEPMFPGCLIWSRPIGMFQMTGEKSWADRAAAEAEVEASRRRRGEH